MDWKQLIGPATLVYVISASIAGVWWAASLSNRVEVAERQVMTSSNAAERIVRLETLIVQLDTQLNRIENKLDRRDRVERGGP